MKRFPFAFLLLLAASGCGDQRLARDDTLTARGVEVPADAGTNEPRSDAQTIPPDDDAGEIACPLRCDYDGCRPVCRPTGAGPVDPIEDPYAP